MLAALAHGAREAAGAHAAGVWLADESSRLTLRAHDGLRHTASVTHVARAHWFAGTAVALDADDARVPLAARAWLTAEGARAVLLAPLTVEHDVVGSLVVIVRGRARDPDALGRVAAIAAGAAPALGVALALGAMHARAERAEALLAIAQRLGDAVDLAAALPEVAGLVSRALAAERCTIVLSPPVPGAGAADSLVLPIMRGGRAIGTLTLTTPSSPAGPSAAVDFARAVARQIGLAADTARLRRELAELETAQQRLVHRETLRAIGDLASGAAHHLNNLLTIVVGRVQLLLRTVDDARVARPLEIVERAAKDGAEVVRRLQEFSRTREVTQARHVDLNTVVAEVLELTRGYWQDTARARGVSIDVQLRTSPRAVVAGDPSGLREAITNVVLNALDAMPKGGRLTIETTCDPGTVTLAVSDTGVGMTDDVRARAREPFFTTKGVKATGLGLSVAYGITRRHGGELIIASSPGEGSTITLRLPALPR